MAFSNKGNFFFLKIHINFFGEFKNIINYDRLSFVDQTAS